MPSSTEPEVCTEKIGFVLLFCSAGDETQSFTLYSPLKVLLTLYACMCMEVRGSLRDSVLS